MLRVFVQSSFKGFVLRWGSRALGVLGFVWGLRGLREIWFRALRV